MCLINCSFASATDCTISPAVVSEKATYNASYPAASALIDYVDDVQLSSKPLIYGYWLGEYEKPASFVIDLGCKTQIFEIKLRSNRGTSLQWLVLSSFNNYVGNFFYLPILLCFRGFAVEIGDTSEGPWTKIAEGQLSDPPKDPPMKKISLEKSATGRFVQYRCINGYSGYCGLQYIGVFQSTNITTTTDHDSRFSPINITTTIYPNSRS